ncbi:rac GTPase-activating protein 1-like isoform X2 [Paramacrobiotus metropolitanus]|uniref:rac GTPase-activating protein 1-like isoform X2 n=1 Tax=Paramacrobiotus metropolitanus TaxID=2943436 RepID=UPI0024463844|nr:rac GTPase-activating protein 1-like isoform X2 [Paramacrobiotus metropolitanus]
MARNTAHDADSPVDSANSADSEFADLLGMYLDIQQGYHSLVSECLETEEIFLDMVRHEDEHVRRQWYIASSQVNQYQKASESEDHSTRNQGIIRNIRAQLQNEMDRRLEAEDRIQMFERLFDRFKTVLESGMVTDEERQRLFRSMNEVSQGRSGPSRVWTGIRKSEDIDAGRISFDQSDDEVLDEEDEMDVQEDIQTTTRRISVKNDSGEMTKFAKLIERGDGDVEIISKTHVRIPENGAPIEARTSLSTRPRRSVAFADVRDGRRSQSVPRLSSEQTTGQRIRRSNETTFLSCDASSQGGSDADSIANVPGPSEMPRAEVVSGILNRRRSRSVGGGLDVHHDFVSKRMWYDTKCTHCRFPVRFGRVGLVCSDCRMVVHDACQALITTPCAPERDRPNADQSSGKWIDLNKIAPTETPRVPTMFVQLVRFIERHLNEEGLYRVPGSVDQVKKLKRDLLKNKFEFRKDDLRDVHVACSLLKNLISGLNEPLLTYQLWPEFTSANMDEFYRLINKLPPVNRETLAYLMLHFRKITQAPNVRMPATNLVKAIAPTIVGNSRPQEQMTPQMLTAETFRAQIIMSKLLDIHVRFWEDMIRGGPAGSGSSNGTNYHAHNSPDSARPAPADRLVQNGLAGFRENGNSFSNVARSIFGNSRNNLSKSNMEPSYFRSPTMAD